jgi:hypothetical protein
VSNFVVEFSNRSFCFTEKLRDLKRTAAEREVRARGGFTLDSINERLDANLSALTFDCNYRPRLRLARLGRNLHLR